MVFEWWCLRGVCLRGVCLRGGVFELHFGDLQVFL